LPGRVAQAARLFSFQALSHHRLGNAFVDIAAIRHGRMQIPMPDLDDPDTAETK